MPHNAIPIGCDDKRAAAGLEHTVHLADRRGAVLHIFKYLRGDRSIECGIRLTEVDRIARGVAEVGKRVAPARRVEQVLRHIDAGDTAVRADLPGHALAEEPRPAADIDDAFAGLRLKQH